MEKQKGKQKLQEEGTSEDGISKPIEVDEINSGVAKEEKIDCVSKAQGLKEEGNKLFQKRDYNGAKLKYDEAIKVLPRDHVEISHIRANIASCYMQLGLNEYPKAIHECDLALQVTPDHIKALLKRARCYEGLNKLDLALKDVCMVLEMDPHNPMASEVSEKLRRTLESKGLRVKDTVIELPPDYVEPAEASPALWIVEDKPREKKKKRSNQIEGKREGENVEKMSNETAEMGKEKIINKKNKKKVKENQVDKQIEIREEKDKEIIEERVLDTSVEEVKKAVKLVFGEDIRWAKLPVNCTLFELREIIHEQFSSLRAAQVKYKDQEGDLVTITTDEELRMAEASGSTQDTLKIYVVEVRPEQDQFFGRLIEIKKLKTTVNSHSSMVKRKGNYKIEDWMTEFAQIFKEQVRVDSHACLNLHELGMKVYSEAMEETVTSEEAQELFDRAADQFREMVALSLIKLGNVHMSGARKRLSLLRGVVSGESVSDRTEIAYESVQKDYTEARVKYEEAMRIKPDLYETFLTLGLQQFEEARFSWYYVLFSNVDLKTWPYEVVLQLYQRSENNIAKSIETWMSEAKVSSEAAKNTGDEESGMDSVLNVILSVIIYERSIMEYKLGLPEWKERLEAAMKKFEVVGDSASMKGTIIANDTLRDLRFQMEDIVQISDEIYEAKSWRNEIPLDKLKEILKRRTANSFHVLDFGI